LERLSQNGALIDGAYNEIVTATEAVEVSALNLIKVAGLPVLARIVIAFGVLMKQ
jgi:hypothetical protein